MASAGPEWIVAILRIGAVGPTAAPVVIGVVALSRGIDDSPAARSRAAQTSFLPQQVRRTLGALVWVGLSRMGVDEFWGLVRSGRRFATPVAPPQGLCLLSVNYPEGVFETEPGERRYEDIQH